MSSWRCASAASARRRSAVSSSAATRARCCYARATARSTLCVFIAEPSPPKQLPPRLLRLPPAPNMSSFSQSTGTREDEVNVQSSTLCLYFITVTGTCSCTCTLYGVGSLIMFSTFVHRVFTYCIVLNRRTSTYSCTEQQLETSCCLAIGSIHLHPRSSFSCGIFLMLYAKKISNTR